MRRKGDFSGDIARKENYYKAFDHASKNKHGKKAIIKFEADLEKNLSDLLYSFENGTFVTSPYRFMTVHEPKKRLIGMLPFPDHVQHWAMLNEVEDYFTRSFSAYTYGGVRGCGPHAYMRMIRKVLRKYPERTTDYLLCDIHHFYPTVNHPVLKSQLRTRIKDNHLLRRLDEIIDSVEGDTGMFPGTKLAQFFSLVYLYLFDHDLKRCFHVGECPALVEYYTKRYIEESIATAKTEHDYEELSKGIQYLSDRFKGYLNRLDFCYRLADDVLILHEDLSLIHI